MEDRMTTGVVGLIVNNRADHAPEVQRVLTRYGNIITSRMGTPSRNKERGFITLAVEGKRCQIDSLTEELRGVEGVQVSSTLVEG
ncbi:MAG: TM1266 family iron-only hydrogenase system putative regulator [Bacillota bacterium]